MTRARTVAIAAADGQRVTGRHGPSVMTCRTLRATLRLSRLGNDATTRSRRRVEGKLKPGPRSLVTQSRWQQLTRSPPPAALPGPGPWLDPGTGNYRRSRICQGSERSVIRDSQPWQVGTSRGYCPSHAAVSDASAVTKSLQKET